MQGETVGAQIVSVPLRLATARAARTFWTIMAGLSGVFAVMMVVLNLLLHIVVLRPVRRMAETAEAVSLGRTDAPEFVMEGRDEIAVLAQSFNRMRRSFARAMRMLEG
jgi:HAMP domain-containing protein